MKVAYIGNFGVSFSTESHYALSFEANGWTVERLQENVLTAKKLDAALDGATLLLYTRTWGITDRTIHARLIDPPAGIVSAAVHLDVWWGLAREQEVHEAPMFRVNHVFTADGDHDVEWRRAGVHHHWLRPGVVDPRLVGETVPGTPDRNRWPYDVAFVGSRSYHPEWPQRPRLIDALCERYGDRFVLVGGHTAPPDSVQRWLPTIREQDLNDFYATVPVLVGDSCFARRDTHYWSDRFYETWGRGGYLISPQIDALEDEIGIRYPSYDPTDLDGLFDRIDGALNDAYHRDVARGVIGRKVRASCTYTNRVREMVHVLGLGPDPS